MPHWNIDDPIDDPRVPEGLRAKAQKLARRRIDEARGRVIAQAQRMTPKKAAKLAAEQGSQLEEKARRRLARQRQFAASAEPNFNKPSLVGEQSTFYATETPENAARFTPKRGYVEIPVSLKEGVRQDLVEKYAIPDDQADALASNAVDRWTQLTRRESGVGTPRTTIQESYTPQFRVHPFSDVVYPAEDMAQTMGEMDEDQPSGGSLDAQDQIIPITPSDPTTKEPLEPTAVDIAKAQVAQAHAVSKGSIVPLAIGAGVLIYLLARR